MKVASRAYGCIAILLMVQMTVVSAADLMDSKTRDLLAESLSGEVAKDHVIQITRHHRIQGSRGYRDAAQYVLQQLRKYGFSEKDAYIESFPSDGKIVYQTWQSPSGWDISQAELRMIEPYDERIVGYPEIAMSVITYSNAGDATAELVWVGDGTKDSDYQGKDVQGKMVLATGYGGSVHRLAVLKYGAKAVICYLDDERAKEFPDMLQYTGMWPRTNELDRVTFGFNLTNRQGEKLRGLLQSGKKVVLRGTVKGTGLEPYFMDVVVAHIRGSEKPEEELVFSCHLDHPKESANDNASGSGAALDIAGTLKKLIQDGRLQQPKRSLRFLWVPEWYGTMAYIDKHPELVGPQLNGKFLANLNLDMVGENLELLHSVLLLTRTPWSIPSVLNDVVENMAEMVDGIEVRTPRGSLSTMNYRVIPYAGGSDHNMFIDRKIPAMMFSHYPDHTHHTSEDTPDKVDPVELERCEIVATAALWYLANLDPEQAIQLLHLATANGGKRLGEAEMRAQRSTSWSDAQNIIDASTKTEIQTIEDVLHFQNSDRVKALAELILQDISAQRESSLKRLQISMQGKGAGDSSGDQTRDNRVPVRLTRGPLSADIPSLKIPEADAKWYASSDFPLTEEEQFEIVNFIDGNRTVSDIGNAASAQFRPLQIKDIVRYLEDLVKAGAVKWK